MSIDRHSENRVWAFEALDELEAFLEDPDFEGDLEEEQGVIGKKRKELRENKYRVVVLGAFNVGKSALINAFLGDEYLPTVLEECTTKITHVVKSDVMKAVLNLTTEATPEEIHTLQNLMTASGVTATVEQPEGLPVVLTYATTLAKDLMKSLRPLLTMSADEDFPQLRTLRAKFDEIFIHLPNDRLQEDVALIDSPGVHSISETNRKIAQEVIPNSHLVLLLIDGQRAGSEHDREFIENVAKQRHRKVFFAINKCDQLNPDEIDPHGHRGPAKDLFRSLNGIIESPELFFVSSLYSLTGHLLEEGRIELADLDQNHKIKIPFGLYESLLNDENPKQTVANYLTKQSRFDTFKTRLLEYLYNENREGAVLESVCRFIDSRSWGYARPLQIKLEMARDIPRLDELKYLRENIRHAIDRNRKIAIDALNAFNAMSAGGTLGGREYPGYEPLVDERLTKAAVDDAIVKPVLDWLKKDENLKKAKRAKFGLVTTELESRLDAFLGGLYRDINNYVGEVEQGVLNRMSELRNGLAPGAGGYVEANRAKVGPLRAGMGGAYFGFFVAGAILFGALGAVAGHYVAIPDAQMGILAGGGIGAAAGALLGLFARAAGAKNVVRRKLARAMNERIDQILFRGGVERGQRVAPVRDQLKEKLAKSRSDFTDALQGVLEKDLNRLNQDMGTVAREEGELRDKQEEIVNRLEPKYERLIALGKSAQSVADVNAARESGGVSL